MSSGVRHAELCDAPGESHSQCHLRRSTAAEMAEFQARTIAVWRRLAAKARARGGEDDLAALWDELADRAERTDPEEW